MTPRSDGQAKRFANACVASPHHLATKAGVDVLASGGNAMDAAIATNLVLGVLTPFMCGFGGDLFVLVWKDGLHAYNGSGRSAARATLDNTLAAIGSDRMPFRGPHSVTVPGAVEAWFSLLEKFGSRSFAELARPALAYAREGFVVSDTAARIIASQVARFDQPWGAGFSEVYGHARAGGAFAQPDLARTIAALSEGGPDVYYRGEIAEAIASTLQAHGALMSVDDLAAHNGSGAEPLRSMYRDVELVQMPPNTQGIVAIEALNMIEGHDLGPHGSSQRHHLMIEAIKFALADRDSYITDPDHMTVDAGELASKLWARARGALINPDKASAPPPGHLAKGGTAYFCAADADGMLVSMIQSNFSGFGSGVTVPGWGINLQNRAAYFSLDPDDVNVIAPRKRTMHTLMPAMVLRDAQPRLVFGTRGGDGQPQTHVQVLTRFIDDGVDIQQAMDEPRWQVSPHNWSVALEPGLPDEVVDGLRRRGHVTRSGADTGPAQAILVTDDGYACASDPRTEGAALGI